MIRRFMIRPQSVYDNKIFDTYINNQVLNILFLFEFFIWCRSLFNIYIIQGYREYYLSYKDNMATPVAPFINMV